MNRYASEVVALIFVTITLIRPQKFLQAIRGVQESYGPPEALLQLQKTLFREDRP